ncbi:amidase signature domain-containing protein [Phlebopus sp. FC_14]|nr:amidase signature domain-containing protein [Phlebopus sp. FC_14]
MSLVRSSQDLAVATRKQNERNAKLLPYLERRLPKPDDDILDVSTYPQHNLTDREKIIVDSDATSIVEQIRSRKITAVEVLNAFVKAAVLAQDVTNCLSEICIKEAFETARGLDQSLHDTGKVVGPLHGLPVSIKDHIKVKGLDTSSGYAAWAYNKVAEADALVVDILRKAGAVIYVKTQNPQTLLSLETNNNVFGRTVNPYNRNLTSGGSSGGEGALIACRGSPMGVGTDIGGSVRIPAAHCGLYGLKGSVARLPHSGLLGSHDGMDAIVGCVGPLARSCRDLALFCQVMLDDQPWLNEPPLLHMPWKGDIARGDGLPNTLSIAILCDDGVVAPHPPIARALNMYEKELKKAGHDIIKWEPLHHQKGWDLIVKLYLLDGGAEYHATIRAGGEEAVPQTRWILEQARTKGPYRVDEIFSLNLEREAFRTEALAHWNATKGRTKTGRAVDAILCPVAPTLAPPHDTTSWWGYTSHWNLLDLPAVVFPAGTYSAKESLSLDLPFHSPRNNVEERIAKQWDVTTYDNAPISLQLVGRRHNEELLLAILGVIEQTVTRHRHKKDC